MSLNSLLIALQGAGFPLSPIALAVQGLISQIQEEQRQQVYGSGKQLPGPKPDRLQDGPPIVRQIRDEELERIVREKWEAIEAAQARDLVPPPKEDTKQASAPVERAQAAINLIAKAPENQVLVPGPGAQEIESSRRAQHQRNARAIAAILLMADT